MSDIRPDLLSDVTIMAQVYIEYPRQDMYPHIYLDGHTCNTQTIYCKGDWDITRCTNCGNERQVRCNFDEDYN